MNNEKEYFKRLIIECLGDLLQDKNLLDKLMEAIPNNTPVKRVDEIGNNLKDALLRLPNAKANSETTKSVMIDAQKWIDAKEKDVKKPTTNDYVAHAKSVKHKKKIVDMAKNEERKREKDCIDKIKSLKMDEWII